MPVLQVEHSAGLFQRVTKGLLDDTFGQLKEVSAMFAAQMRDSSRRSFGVQADQPDTSAPTSAAEDTQQVVAGAEASSAACRAAEQQQQQQQEKGIDEYSQDGFEPVTENQLGRPDIAAEAAGSAGHWSAVLPEDEVHPALHFEALLKAQRTAAARGVAAENEEIEDNEFLEEPAAAADCSSGSLYDSEVADEVQDLAVLAGESSSVIAEEPAAIGDNDPAVADQSSVMPEESLVAESPAAAAAVDANSGARMRSDNRSQQYGSNSFESYVAHDSSNKLEAKHRQLLEGQVGGQDFYKNPGCTHLLLPGTPVHSFAHFIPDLIFGHGEVAQPDGIDPYASLTLRNRLSPSANGL